MSDLSIPGVSGTYDKYIEALMKVERIPRDNAQKDLDKFKDKRLAWQNVNSLSSKLRTSSNALYSFNNPFAEKTVVSSDEGAITATTTREAENNSFKIAVERIAKPDSFLSSPMQKDQIVPAGKYTFVVGDKTISFNWKGGSYKSFAETINKRGKGILSVSEIKTTRDSTSLLFKSEVPGIENRLQFEDDALTFALEQGIIKKNDTSSIGLDKTNLILSPRSSDKINFSETVRAAGGNVLEITLSKRSAVQGSTAQNGAPVSSPLPESAAQTFEQLGSVSYAGITITNENSSAGTLPETSPLPAGTQNNTGTNTQAVAENAGGENLNVFSLESTRGVLIPMPPLSNTNEEQKIIVDLAGYGDVKALVLNNPNPDTEFDIKNIRIYDPAAVGDYVPANPVSVAQNAVVNFEGITIERPTNDIDDLVPGVTFHLHDKTEKQATLSIEPDKELVKNAIIEFVANYNNMLTEINILTQNRPEIIDELTYLTDEEREKAHDRLGLLMGDTTLNSLKNTLRVKTSAAYKPSDDSTIIMLSSFGISTNSNRGGSIESSALRGYLEIDEKKLDDAIANNLSDIKLFFGYDSSGDMLVDSGLAYTIYEQLTPYTQRGGIFATRTATLDSQISSTTKRIEDYDKKLAKKEKELKQKYSSLEGTLQNLQTQSDKIKSFSDQNNKRE